MTSFYSNSLYDVEEAMDSTTIFTLVVLGGTILIITWLNNHSKNVKIVQNRKNGPSLPKKKEIGNNQQPKKKERQNCKRATSSQKNQYTQPNLINNLKSHSTQIAGPDYSPSEVLNTRKGNHSIERKPSTNLRWETSGGDTTSRTVSESEESFTSSSSGSKLLSRRQKKNKRKKAKQNAQSIASASRSEPFNNDEENVHASLLSLCVNTEDRIISGFPYETQLGTFIFRAHGYSSVAAALSGHTLVEAETCDLNALENDYPEESNSDASEENVPSNWDLNMNICDTQTMRIPEVKKFYFDCASYQHCKRCGSQFDALANGQFPCYFHPRKASIKKDGSFRYQCCLKVRDNMIENSGCSLFSYHVYHHIRTGLNGPLVGFVPTKPKSRTSHVFGLDCEMVYTSLGFEVGRVTIVGFSGETVLDSYVQPCGVVFDYNTKFSGILPEHLIHAPTFQDTQELVCKIVCRSDILVGHSLEGDLSVLKLLHRRVVDTSLLFKEESFARDGRGGSPVPNRMALKSLVKKHLHKEIQQGFYGHNSKEDALSALNLALFFVGYKTTSSKNSNKNRKVAPLPLVLQALSV